MAGDVGPRAVASRVADFRTWLHARDVDCEFEPKWIEGFWLVSGGRPIEATHVAQAIKFAEEARTPADTLAKLRELGQLVLAYERAVIDGDDLLLTLAPVEDTPPPAAPKQVAAAALEPDASDQAATSAAVEPTPPPEPEPDVSGDSAASVAVEPAPPPKPEPRRGRTFESLQAEFAPQAASETASPANPAPRTVKLPRIATSPPVDELDGDTVAAQQPADHASPPTTAQPRSRRAVIAIGLAAVLSAAAVAVVIIDGSSSDATDSSTHATTAARSRARPAPARTLRPDLPPGWQLAVSNQAPAGAVIAFRGGTEADPDHSLFLAERPLTGAAAPLQSATDAGLAPAARQIERAVARQIESDGGTYRSAGCSVARLGDRPAAICEGAATRSGDSFSIRTYLRIQPEAAQIAVSSARPAATDAARDADRIVASLASTHSELSRSVPAPGSPPRR